MATSDQGAVTKVNLRTADTDGFLIDGVQVTATAAELNAVAGNGLSAAELAVLDGATAGTQVAEKAVIADENVNIGVVKATALHLGASGSETAVTPVNATLLDAKGDIVAASAADTPAKVTVGSNGQALLASSGSSAGVAWGYPPTVSPQVLAGTDIKAATFDPMFVTTAGVNLSDGDLSFQEIHIPYPMTITGIGFVLVTQGDTTADNENRIGLYTSDGTDLTLVASTADSGTFWESAAGNTRKDLSTPYAAAAGRFWVGHLSNWSAVATTPKIGVATAPYSGILAHNMVETDEKRTGFVTAGGVATLSSSVAWSDVSVASSPKFFFVY